jgi:hypothetical protein
MLPADAALDRHELRGFCRKWGALENRLQTLF